MATSVPSVPPPGQAKAVVTKAAEGQYRPGPYLLSEGWLSATAGKFMNWWQMGYSIQPYGPAGAMVEACVSAYSQTGCVRAGIGDRFRKTVARRSRRRICTGSCASPTTTSRSPICC